jgi:hypothetical protein
MLLALAMLLASESLNGLLARVAEAYGGEKALAQVTVLRETGTLESPRGTAQTVRVFAAPDRLRIDIRYPSGEGETRVLAGPHAWRNGEPVAGPPRDAMLLQAARLALPGILFKSRRRLVDLGELRREDRTLRGVGVPLEGNLQLAVEIDPKTALIVHSEGQLASPGGPIRFATDYRDFRREHGLLFAFSESNFASGQRTGETRLTKIEILDAVPAGAFSP